jgi:hypothetical protein
MEVDKVLANFNIQGGTFDQLLFQSSSGGAILIINNAQITTLNGTPQKGAISNSTIGAFYAGTLNFGTTNEISCDQCTIGTIKAAGSLDNKVDTKYTMSNGIITVPNSYPPAAWASPGANAMFAIWNGTLLTEGNPFQVIDITKDANNTYIRTSLSSGFPVLPTDPTTGLSIYANPAPKFTCKNCVGSPDAVDLSQPGAQGQPLYSYSKRSYTGSPQALQNIKIWGKIVKIAVDVVTPYTGTQNTLTLNVLGEYGTQVTSNGSSSSYKASINLKIAGAREILPNSVSGLQLGDNTLAPGLIWFSNAMSPSLSGDITNEPNSVWPTFTIEVITDQGVVSP